MMKSLPISLLLLALAAPAFADDLPKHNCQQPVLPNAQSSETVVKFFNKRFATYKTCIDKFVEEQRSISKNTTDVAKANQAFEAAEAAQKEYNAMADELNSRKPDEEERQR
jgi:hypothetical protein